MIQKFVGFLFVFGLMISCTVPKSDAQKEQIRSEIAQVLNDWHLAASEAQFDRYFGHMADSSIFIGTDATEHWTKAEFMAFSKPYFDKGKAWSFKADVRRIYIDDVSNVAWFDEELDTPNLGPSRGSGVIIKENQVWKIYHYNLSIPIPNAISDTVVAQVKQALQVAEPVKTDSTQQN